MQPQATPPSGATSHGPTVCTNGTRKQGHSCHTGRTGFIRLPGVLQGVSKGIITKWMTTLLPCLAMLMAVGLMLHNYSPGRSEHVAAKFGRSNIWHGMAADNVDVRHSDHDVYAVFNSKLCGASKWQNYCRESGDRQLCELPSIWQNCSGFYLDIGTNVGVQLRKLYDPEQFPNAEVLPYFDKLFGKNRSSVCSLGLEPNPYHTSYLEALNEYFVRREYPCLVVTGTAASIAPGRAKFYLDNMNPMEWGSSLTKRTGQMNGKNKFTTVNVNLLPLPSFLLEVVRPILLQALLATGKRLPVMMKIDAEGAEYSLLPGLLVSGTLCDIDVVVLEAHTEGMRAHDGVNMTVPDMLLVFDKMRKAYPSCRTRFLDLDDETYLDGKNIALPP